MTAPTPRRHRFPTWLLLAIAAVGIYLAIAIGGDTAPGSAGRSPEEIALWIILGLLVLLLAVMVAAAVAGLWFLVVLVKAIVRSAREERRTHGL